MNECQHKKTTVCSTETAYWIQCLSCGEQWDESEWDEERERALDEFAKEAEATGN